MVAPLKESGTKTVAAHAAAALLLLLLSSQPSRAATFRFFGSGGAESQLTPANESSPLNPRNVAGIPYRTNVSDVTLFADALGTANRWKVHIKARGSSSDRGEDGIEAGELYLQLAPRPWLDVTIGRVIEKWGTGYAWNPTAFVSPPKNPADPNDRNSSYRGMEMLRTDLFLGRTNVSLYAMPHQAFAARIYRLVGGTDLSVNLRSDRNYTREGLSVARVFGDALELHGEAAHSNMKEGEGFNSALIGGQYTLPGGVNLVAELYHGGDGLSAGRWRSFTDLAGTDLREANRQFVPLQMARNYSFLRLAAPFQGGKSDVELLAITSLRDRSTIVRLSLNRQLTRNLSVYLIDSEFPGKEGSEMAAVQIRRSTALGCRVSF